MREGLSEKEIQNLLNAEKGFTGEKLFDLQLEQLPESEWLLMRDLLLQCNNTHFQIDNLLISRGKIYLLDVKNYEGEFYIEADQWFSFYGKEIKNPVQNLQRAESLLRQLLHSIGITHPIESYVVFINPEFTLFQAPRTLPIILPTQIPRFIKKLSKIASGFGPSETTLANKLCSLHITESPFTRVPPYKYEQLKKGHYCKVCHSYSLRKHNRKLVCKVCEFEETFEAAIMRAVKEFSELFPDRRITVGAIKEWCGLDVKKSSIQWVLKTKLKFVYRGGHSYYVFHDKT